MIRALMLYSLAVPVFLWSWLAEQPGAIKMAWLHSFFDAHYRIKNR